MTDRHDSAPPAPDAVDGLERTYAAARTATRRIWEGGNILDNILTIIVVVLVVLFIVGYFGRGRFRA